MRNKVNLAKDKFMTGVFYAVAGFFLLYVLFYERGHRKSVL